MACVYPEGFGSQCWDILGHGPLVYITLGNFTSKPATCRHLECQLRRRFLAFSFPLSAPPALGVEGTVRFFQAAHPWGWGLVFHLWGVRSFFALLQGYPHREFPQGYDPPPLPAFLRRSSSAFFSFSDSRRFMWHSSS